MFIGSGALATAGSAPGPAFGSGPVFGSVAVTAAPPPRHVWYSRAARADGPRADGAPADGAPADGAVGEHGPRDGVSA